MPEDERELLAYFVRNSSWCAMRLCGETITVRTGKLEAAFGDLDREIKAMPRHQFRKKIQFGPNCLINFFDAKGCVGGISFHTYLPVVGILQFDTVGKSGEFPVSKKSIEQLRKAISPLLSDLRSAYEGLNEKNLEVVHRALESLADKRFRDESPKSIPKMEPFLKHADEETRRFAASMILELDPAHICAEPNCGRRCCRISGV